MIYLKAFERFNKLKLFESNNSELFELITSDEFLEREDKHGKDIPYVYQNDNEKEMIVNFLKDEYGEFTWDYSLSSGQTLELVIGSKSGGKKFIEIILQSPDEWFYVKEYFYVWNKGSKYSSWRQQAYKTFQDSEFVYESYFRCDSLEGLFEFIKNRKMRIEEL